MLPYFLGTNCLTFLTLSVIFSCLAKPNSELDQPEQLGDTADEPGHEAGPAGRCHQHGAVAGGLQGRLQRL